MIQIFIDKPSEKKNFLKLALFDFEATKTQTTNFSGFWTLLLIVYFFPSSCNYHFWRKGKFSRRAAILVVIFARLLIYGFWCVRKKYHQRHEIQKLFSLLRKIIFTFFEKSVERIFNLVQTLTFHTHDIKPCGDYWTMKKIAFVVPQIWLILLILFILSLFSLYLLHFGPI